ncbi:MAG: hypothetical protein GVY04_04315 [Cyanobacteria bacterium]|jgi:hypothetical protein|nr:hypothetical protein [Cyanobacteria bacterium GSL.Bin1]
MVTSTDRNKGKQKPFRYVLPTNATLDQQRKFKRDIAFLKSPKSKWAIYPDWTQRGEAVSYIVIPKEAGTNQKAIYAGIRVGTALSRFHETMCK